MDASDTRFSDGCTECELVLIDLRTGKPFPDDSETMHTVRAVWGRMSMETREAIHRVCCLNSRARGDLHLAARLHGELRRALEAN